MKKFLTAALCVVICFVCVLSSSLCIFAEDNSETADVLPFELDCASAVLMDSETGCILYEHNADTAYPPASVTKIMTLLLVMEAIEDGRLSLTETVSASANAASMGGSQIFLEEGEEMSVEDLLKSVIIASANDAALALAEHVAGSEEIFVSMMNARAKKLGMKNTLFENTNGLDDTVTNHVTSARDIAIMSAELIKYDKILEYSGTWMDTIRNGSFGLTNTNRLVRFYEGATGLKTGSTAKAKFCISATAKRGDMHLIAVIMGAPTRDIRNECAKKLLDYGFATYCYYTDTDMGLEGLTVQGGIKEKCNIEYSEYKIIVKKTDKDKIERSAVYNESISAPIKQGDSLGLITYTLNGEKIGENPIISKENISKIAFFDVLGEIFKSFLMK